MAGIRVVDFNGIEYDSITDMCNAYGISDATYHSRIKMGWSLEDALTKPLVSSKKVVYDHHGKPFASQKLLCKEYGISVGMFIHRISNGYTLEQALTLPKRPGRIGKASNTDVSKRKTNRSPYKIFLRDDTLGNVYSSFKEMCDAYNIMTDSFKLKLERNNGCELIIALISGRDVRLVPDYISIDNIAYYRGSNFKGEKSTREIIELFRPDLVEAYDSVNPTGEYRPLIIKYVAHNQGVK